MTIVFQLLFSWFPIRPHFSIPERTATLDSCQNSNILNDQTTGARQQRWNPCSPLPKSGTHTSGVVTRKDKVPNVMTIASPAPTKPVFGEKMPKTSEIPIPIIKIPNPWENPPVIISLHLPEVLRFISSPSFSLYSLYSGASLV